MTARDVAAGPPAAAPAGRELLLIDVWADVICPFCLLGDEQLRRAIEAEGLDDRVEVRIRRHSFELDPHAPTEARSSLDYLAAKMGTDRDTVAQREEKVRSAAQELGLGFTLDRPVANTLPVHRAVQHASREGRDHELFRAVQRAYFAGDLDPFDEDALVELASGLGLEERALRAALADPVSEQAVRTDEDAARQLGVNAVPFTVIAGRLGVPGAVGVDAFREALREGVALQEADGGVDPEAPDAESDS
ncbi:DsbA family oxidoreductase [Brachybacterium hainanense]|uniref:DsbA family protein n=1 Tax=Brachybacterium hainanense TaxID=1541174 RepID=A0ABV6R9D7_9MICO